MLDDPLPEIFTRLAKIRSEEGKPDDALELYDKARDFLFQRIRYNPFFGNLNIMKWMIWNIYKLREFDPDFIELYDLYYVLEKLAKVRFVFDDKEHEVESVKEEGGIEKEKESKTYETLLNNIAFVHNDIKGRESKNV